jgi:UDP:flavonoid glycosyltransferase YjiC (YdhE family)
MRSLFSSTVAEQVEEVAAMLRSLTDMDVDVVLTGFRGEPWPVPQDPGQVSEVGFVPIADLLDGVEAVVLAGGSGTLTAALGRGLPLVVCPLAFDQFPNAELAVATGAAVRAAPGEVGAAPHAVLADGRYRPYADWRSRRYGR